jgi:hypothetical protein
MMGFDMSSPTLPMEMAPATTSDRGERIKLSYAAPRGKKPNHLLRHA